MENKNVEELALEIDHTLELIESDRFIHKLKREIKETPINDQMHDELYEKIIRVLDYLGTLSNLCFVYTDQFEDIFYKEILDSKIAKMSWLEATNDIHNKYDQQKNRCFKLIDVLDLKYFSKFKKEPPNWRCNDMSALLDYKSYMKNN